MMVSATNPATKRPRQVALIRRINAILKPARKKWRQELNQGQNQRENDKRVDHQRELGPFEGLAETGQHQNPPGRDHREVPKSKNPLPELHAGDAAAGEHRNAVIEKGEERVAQPSQHDALGVVVAEASPGEKGELRDGTGHGHAGGGEQAKEQRGGEGYKSSHAVPPDEAAFHTCRHGLILLYH